MFSSILSSENPPMVGFPYNLGKLIGHHLSCNLSMPTLNVCTPAQEVNIHAMREVSV
jgi:hypothetical protein